MDTSSTERGLTWLARALVGVFALAAMPAFAACDNTDYGSKLDTYYASGCLPPNDKVRARVAEQRKRFFTDLTSADVYVPRAIEAIEKLEGEVAQHADQNGDIRQQFQTLQQSLNAAALKLRVLPRVETVAAKPMDFAELLPDFWNVDASVRDEAGGLPAKMLRDAGCAGKSPPDAVCDAAFQEAITVADDVHVAHELILDLHSPQRAQFVSDARLRADRWHGYLYDTQFQFWWELVANKYLEEHCPAAFTALTKLVDKTCHALAKDSYGNRLGFREVPDSRAILLHPDVGVGYVDEEPDGQRFKPLLVFQWVGLQWWDWKQGEVSGLRGLSLVSTVADTATTSRTGFGLQFQYGAFSLALTSHSGDFVVTLNAGLVDKVGTVNQRWADKFKTALEQ